MGLPGSVSGGREAGGCSAGGRLPNRTSSEVPTEPELGPRPSVTALRNANETGQKRKKNKTRVCRKANPEKHPLPAAARRVCASDTRMGQNGWETAGFPGWAVRSGRGGGGRFSLGPASPCGGLSTGISSPSQLRPVDSPRLPADAVRKALMLPPPPRREGSGRTGDPQGTPLWYRSAQAEVLSSLSLCGRRTLCSGERCAGLVWKGPCLQEPEPCIPPSAGASTELPGRDSLPRPRRHTTPPSHCALPPLLRRTLRTARAVPSLASVFSPLPGLLWSPPAEAASLIRGRLLRLQP